LIKELPLDCGQNLGRQDIVVDAENRLMAFDMSDRLRLPQYDLPDLPQYHLPELRGGRGTAWRHLRQAQIDAD